jgi:thiamine biosynthesis protein ThiI
VTGEVIGQVASQTLENLTTISAATAMQVLRPLVGMDKDEIADQAERLGTYAISIIPDQDCCQLFTPRHPGTRVTQAQAVAAEAVLPIDDMVQAAVAGVQVQDYAFPVIKYRAARK